MFEREAAVGTSHEGLLQKWEEELTRPNSGLVEVLFEYLLGSQLAVPESVSNFFRIRFINTWIYLSRYLNDMEYF